MVTTVNEAERLLSRGEILQLGLLAARARRHKTAGFIEDEAVGLYLGEVRDPQSRTGRRAPSEAPLRWLHYHPAQGQGLDRALACLRELREAHPQAWIHGFSPSWLKEHGGLQHLVEAGLNSLALFTGELKDDNHSDWQAYLDSPLPLVASFVYTPDFEPAQLLARLEKLRRSARLTTLVPLPASVGDRILIPGATTDGTEDVSVLAACRLVLPQLHLRSSWAVTGWKVAQVGLAFGADELAGWGIEEFLAYSHRVRPAARVERDELLAGIEEAGYQAKEMTRCDWAF